MFRSIASNEFPPFTDLRIDFKPVPDKPSDVAEVHLFTGINGAGKTRILAILAAMLGNPNPLVKRLKGMENNIRIFGSDVDSPPPDPQRWGNVFLATGGNANWHQGNQFMQWCQKVPAFAYSGTAYVSDAQIAVMATVPKPDRTNCLSFTRVEANSKELLQAIANLKLQAAMDTLNQPDDAATPTRATRIMHALESAIGRITNVRFLFHVTTYPQTSLQVRWGAFELPFDVLPDGLRSLIGWLAHAVVMMDAWLQGKGDLMTTEAVFLLDEIESHLHPAWQRRLLPAFQKLFPRAQIFVASHSPFLIASLNDGWIHPLSLRSDGSATVGQPLPASKGDSYISVLEEIMGVEEFYDPETEQLLAQFRSRRDLAYQGSAESQAEARRLAGVIGGRSIELQYLMGRELAQMDRQLNRGNE